MNIIKFMRIRRKNKMLKELERQSKRNKCCETCKYCKLYDVTLGYDHYMCILKEPNFNGSDAIYRHICDNYAPCKKYKKYLNSLKGDKNECIKR